MEVGVLTDSTIMPIVSLSVNTVAGVDVKLERTAHESIRGGSWISPPRMGGACEQASELQQFPVILHQGQLDDTFALAWDHHIAAGAGYYINAGAVYYINAGVVYSRASKRLVSDDIVAWLVIVVSVVQPMSTPDWLQCTV